MKAGAKSPDWRVHHTLFGNISYVDVFYVTSVGFFRLAIR